jgi:HEXXH motif-containing protein
VKFRYHDVSRSVFDALAAGGGGADAVRELAAGQYSKHVLLLLGVLKEAQAVGHRQAPLARRGFDLLAAVQAHDPMAANAVIWHPSVGTWALRALRALRGGPRMHGAEPGRLCAVAAAAAIRAGLPADIEVSAAGGFVLLPSLGAAVVDGRTAIVRSGASGAEVESAADRVVVPADPHQDAPGWQALRRLRAGSFEVLIDDLDPFRMPAATNTAPRLRALEAARWDTAFQGAWRLVERHHPAIAAELAEAVRVIVPLIAPPRGQASFTSQEAFGAIALSESADPRAFALALAHEVQHLKLSALIDMRPLTFPDDGRRFYAPWRDDPRPASGLLQGTYAHLGVCAFWRRQRHVDAGPAGIRAHAEFARWRTATGGAIETLMCSGSLTPAGAEFVRIMQGTMSSWQNDSVPEEAQALARTEAERHLTDWQSSRRAGRF